MKEITSSERQAGRPWRVRRRLNPTLGYMLSIIGGVSAYRNFARTLPRADAFNSLEHAAQCRRIGGPVGKRFARFTLTRARADDLRWRAAGGYLP